MRPTDTALPSRSTLGTLGLIAFLVTGCGSFGTYCADKAACEGGNEADEEACAISFETLQDRAVARACEGDFDEYFDCLEGNATCEEETFDESGCEEEASALSECLQ
jgi:hypothetical protein